MSRNAAADPQRFQPQLRHLLQPLRLRSLRLPHLRQRQRRRKGRLKLRSQEHLRTAPRQQQGSSQPKLKRKRTVQLTLLSGSICVRKSITSAALTTMGTQRTARICAKETPPPKECAPPRTSNIPELHWTTWLWATLSF